LGISRQLTVRILLFVTVTRQISTNRNQPPIQDEQRTANILPESIELMSGLRTFSSLHSGCCAHKKKAVNLIFFVKLLHFTNKAIKFASESLRRTVNHGCVVSTKAFLEFLSIHPADAQKPNSWHRATISPP
jgi:hypothetical protein